jgi:hypothetical protein
LWIFVDAQKLGRLVASDSGVWLERDPDTVREPDIVFFSAEKVPPGVRVTGYSETVPDLVVEVQSPSDSMREVSAWCGWCTPTRTLLTFIIRSTVCRLSPKKMPSTAWTC